MMATCYISIRPTATTDQLCELADTLERWCNDQLDEGACCFYIHDQHLSDLKGGELPQPAYLGISTLSEAMNKANGILGEDPIVLEPYRLEQIRLAFGEEGTKRNCLIFIEYNPMYGHKEPIETLRFLLNDDLVENIEIEDEFEERE